jgi:hypothetical protein
LHEIAVLQFGRVFVIVRIERVPPRRNQREVGRALRAVFFEDKLGGRLKLVFVMSRSSLAHRFHDSQARDARGFADDGDFAGTFESAHRVEYRIEVLHVDLRRERPELLNENLFARRATVPGIVFGRSCRGRRVAGRRAAQNFGAKRRVECAPFAREGFNRFGELVARERGFDPRGRDRRVAGNHRRAEHAFAPLRASVKIERRALRLSINHQNRSRLDYARQVVELIVLAQRLFAGALGRALQYGYAVADLRHHLGPARGELFGREYVGKDRLSEQACAERDECSQ